jgi:hypothetical protein
MLSQETAPSLQIQFWSIQRFVFYVRNPRKNDTAVDRMCSSIREFGFKVPVLARSDGTVVDGHLRLKWQSRIVITGGRQQPQPAPAAKPEAAAPARPPITQADIDVEVAKRRQKMPPQMETECDLAARAAAGGIQ